MNICELMQDVYGELTPEQASLIQARRDADAFGGIVFVCTIGAGEQQRTRFVQGTNKFTAFRNLQRLGLIDVGEACYSRPTAL